MKNFHKKNLSAWDKLNKSGFSFEKFFLDKNIKNIAIYGAGVLGRRLYEELKDTQINVSCFIDRNDKVTLPYDVKVITPLMTNNLSEIDAVVITSIEYINIVDRLQRHISIRFINLIEILIPFKVYDYYLKASDYIKANGANLLLLDFSFPTLFLKNPSPREKLCRYINQSGDVLGNLPSFLYDIFDNIPAVDDNYLNEILNKYTFIDIDGIPHLADYQSDYCNIINHCRLTTDTPDEYFNTIHFFGPCIGVGYAAEDKHTIESNLQKIINDKKLDNNVYRVVNHSCWHKKETDNQDSFKRILKTPISSNDILVIVSPMLWKYYDFNRKDTHIHYHDIVPALDRPHDQGEIFMDVFHITHKGYRLIAQYIYKILQNFVSSQQNLPPQKTNLIKKTANTHRSSNKKYSPILKDYLGYLKKEKAKTNGTIGSIVMNCNPFTYGHRYLIEKALTKCDFLYIFVVEEDKSEFPFEDRYELVEQGVSDLKNVKVLKSGKLIISSLTFPEYFSKKDNNDIQIDASSDITLFAQSIAPALDIKYRFAGEEPLCQITNQYNQTMKDILPKYGIDFIVAKRKELNNTPISASLVRKYIEDNRIDELKELVPETTYKYLTNKYPIKL